MGNWDEKAKELFYLFTHTLLSLLLPLSFLLLAKLSTVQYYLQRLSLHHYYSQQQPLPYLLSVLALSINPYILYVLVFIITLTSLIHSLTNKITILRNSSSKSTTLVLAWILLCVFQVCVGLGIEGSIMAGFYDDEPSFVVERNFLSKVVFLFGLHETTRAWCGMVVRPVVDDTVFAGVVRKEKWVEKVGVAMSLGILWWWRLRDDVESLVVMVEVKKEQLMMDVGIFNDYLFGLWLYYLTVIVGIVRVVKGLIWIIGIIFPFCRTKAIGISKLETSENVDDNGTMYMRVVNIL